MEGSCRKELLRPGGEEGRQSKAAWLERAGEWVRERGGNCLPDIRMVKCRSNKIKAKGKNLWGRLVERGALS